MISQHFLFEKPFKTVFSEKNTKRSRRCNVRPQTVGNGANGHHFAIIKGLDRFVNVIDGAIRQNARIELARNDQFLAKRAADLLAAPGLSRPIIGSLASVRHQIGYVLIAAIVVPW